MVLTQTSVLAFGLFSGSPNLMVFEDGIYLNKEVRRGFQWYSQKRPHQALDYRTPEVVYWKMRSLLKKLD